MIVSPKYKFVFIANPKSGSSAIQSVLENIDDKKIIIGKAVPKNLNDFLSSKHTSSLELQNNHPEYKNYFKFAFVRNPWSRVLSWYLFLRTSKLPKRNTSNISFKEFVNNKWRQETVWANEELLQYRFTQNCDFIGRLENIQEDFNVICDKIGISSQKLPHINETNHKHYTEYYDDETRQIVAKALEKEIKYFNYKFGE